MADFKGDMPIFENWEIIIETPVLNIQSPDVQSSRADDSLVQTQYVHCRWMFSPYTCHRRSKDWTRKTTNKNSQKEREM